MDSGLVSWLLGIAVGAAVGSVAGVIVTAAVIGWAGTIKMPSYKREKALVDAERKRKATRMLANGQPADYVIAACGVSKDEVKEILRS